MLMPENTLCDLVNWIKDHSNKKMKLIMQTPMHAGKTKLKLPDLFPAGVK